MGWIDRLHQQFQASRSILSRYRLSHSEFAVCDDGAHCAHRLILSMTLWLGRVCLPPRAADRRAQPGPASYVLVVCDSGQPFGPLFCCGEPWVLSMCDGQPLFGPAGWQQTEPDSYTLLTSPTSSLTHSHSCFSCLSNFLKTFSHLLLLLWNYVWFPPIFRKLFNKQAVYYTKRCAKSQLSARRSEPLGLHLISPSDAGYVLVSTWKPRLILVEQKQKLKALNN